MSATALPSNIKAWFELSVAFFRDCVGCQEKSSHRSDVASDTLTTPICSSRERRARPFDYCRARTRAARWCCLSARRGIVLRCCKFVHPPPYHPLALPPSSPNHGYAEAPTEWVEEAGEAGEAGEMTALRKVAGTRAHKRCVFRECPRGGECTALFPWKQLLLPETKCVLFADTARKVDV